MIPAGFLAYRAELFFAMPMTDLLVVITDDLEMKGITDSFTVPEAAVRAIQVGSDMVLICHTPDEQFAVVDALTAAVKSGEISERRLVQSLGRLLFLKEQFLMGTRDEDPEDLRELIGSDEHLDIAETIAKKALAKTTTKNALAAGK